MTRVMTPLVRGVALLLALICAAPAGAQEAKAPKDYRKLIGDREPTLWVPAVTRGIVQIGHLRPDQRYPGADWIACVKTDAKGKPRLWAIFLREEEIVHWREALPVDGCAGESYAALKVVPKK